MAKTLFMELSIVIISNNDAVRLESTLKSIAGLDTDVLVYDTGSTDGSQSIAVSLGAKLHVGILEGFGKMRYKASQLALYDWILMLHTGETIDDQLKSSIQLIDFGNVKQVYRIRFKNYFGKKWLRYGEWGKYSFIRLANRRGVAIPHENVDETIFSQTGIQITAIKGFIIHRIMKGSNFFARKILDEALLSAARYHRKGIRSGSFRLLFSSSWSFIRNYFFKLGFLDGWEGYICARMSAWYTFMKYTRLRELNESV